MVEPPLNKLLDACEIAHHPLGIELTGTAVDGDYPVVAVAPGAFALVGEREAVGGRDLELF